MGRRYSRLVAIFTRKGEIKEFIIAEIVEFSYICQLVWNEEEARHVA